MMEHSEIRPLSDLDDYEVADGDPDIRGWTVTTADGAALGKVVELIADVNGMRVAAVDVDFDGAGRRQVPIEDLRIDTNQHSVIANASAVPSSVHGQEQTELQEQRELPTAAIADTTARRESAAPTPSAARGDDTVRVARMEEELAIAKRLVERGAIGIRKRVETEHVSAPVTTTREEIIVERRPVSADRSTEIEITDDEIRIPIIEQEVVVEKRPVLKEEVVVKTDAVTEQRTVEADLRRERVDVDRTGTGRTDTRDQDHTKDGA